MRIENLNEIDEKLHRIKVVDIMSRFAITTTPDTTVTDLAHLLMRFKISGVPVVSEKKEILGVVTASDLFEIMKNITEKIGKKSESAERSTIFVRDIMTENVFTVCENTSIFDVVKLMCQKNIHTLPVISGKEIVGIIGRRDAINAFYAER